MDLTNLDSVLGFPGGSDSNESTCNAGVLGSIPGLGRERLPTTVNSMDRGAWQATVQGSQESNMTD